MLIIYFSATGNSKFIAELFSRKMDAKCLSIEDDVNFVDEIKSHDIIAFCYPIYASRVPRIMREFVTRHMSELDGKKIIIFTTQVLFSGDGARVFTDMFWEGSIEVIYAEHFLMPSNVGNVPIWKPTKKKVQRYIIKAKAKMDRVCNDIRAGIVKKRGFSRFSQLIGSIQGKAWQGESREGLNQSSKWQTVEERASKNVKIRKNCNACGICVKICPMNNLEKVEGKIEHKHNCTICYRCVNKCPKKAITVLFHIRPWWQYSIGRKGGKK